MIIVDLDGVYADFQNAACVVHGKWDYVVDKWNFFEDWEGVDTVKFWADIHALGSDFYGHVVQPYPWLRELTLAIDEADDWIIMTNSDDHSFGYIEKREWIDKYIQPIVNHPVKLIISGEKHLLAGSDRLLIDDHDVNTEKFRASGGITFVFPQLWNLNRDLVNDRMELLQSVLKWWEHKQRDERKCDDISTRF